MDVSIETKLRKYPFIWARAIVIGAPLVQLSAGVSQGRCSRVILTPLDKAISVAVGDACMSM